MIPAFNADGLLPPGIHIATIQEFETRFVYNITRTKIYGGLKQLIVDLKVIGCKTIFVDGSYVTNKTLPKDVDICWDNEGVDENVVKIVMPILMNIGSARMAQQSKYFADIFPAYIQERDSKKLFIDFFQSCKVTGKPKGIIKIEIND